MSQRDNEVGVYYRREDYAGVWVRLLIEAIDAIVASALSLALSALLIIFLDQELLLSWALVATWVIIWFVYFVIIKRTRFRTLGYILGGVKVVNLRGECPSLTSLAIRLIFVVIGPFNVIIDLFWISGDNHKQALRDKFAETYVIKKNAQPAGQGKVLYTKYSIMAANFLFREVEDSAS